MTLLSNSLKIRNAPNLPGLSFRGFRGKEDFPHMAQIINAVNQTDQLEGHTTAEDVEQNYAFLQRSDTSQDLVFIEFDGIPVGYGRCMWDKELNGTYLYSFFIHMKKEGRGRGSSAGTAHRFPSGPGCPGSTRRAPPSRRFARRRWM